MKVLDRQNNLLSKKCWLGGRVLAVLVSDPVLVDGVLKQEVVDRSRCRRRSRDNGRCPRTVPFCCSHDLGERKTRFRKKSVRIGWIPNTDLVVEDPNRQEAVGGKVVLVGDGVLPDEVAERLGHSPEILVVEGRLPPPAKRHSKKMKCIWKQKKINEVMILYELKILKVESYSLIRFISLCMERIINTVLKF